MERGVESTDALVVFEQSGQTALEHSFGMIFIELRQHQRLGKLEAGFVVGVAHELDGVLLADTWTDADPVENDVASRPILTEKTCLRFSERGQLVIVLLKKRSLRMTDEKENPHSNLPIPSN